MSYKFSVYIPFSEELKSKIFLETGSPKVGENFEIDLSRPENSIYRPHFITMVKKYGTKFPFFQTPYYRTEKPVESVELLTGKEIYELWLNYVRDVQLEKIKNNGYACLENFSLLWAFNLDVLSQSEIEQAQAEFEKTQEKERLEEELQRANEVEDREKQKFQEDSPDFFFNISLAQFGGVFVTTRNPIPKGKNKNWMAKVTPDPRKPGGIERQFYPKAKGDNGFYVIDKPIKLGDCLEFCASNYHKKHGEEKRYAYAVVTAARFSDLTGSLRVAVFKTKEEMFFFSEKFKTQNKPNRCDTALNAIVDILDSLSLEDRAEVSARIIKAAAEASVLPQEMAVA